MESLIIPRTIIGLSTIQSTDMEIVLVVAAMILLAILVAFKIKPAYALVGISLAVGLALQMPWVNVLEAMLSGFWSTLASVGLVLLTGAWLGKLVEVSGATQVITRSLIHVFGEKHVEWAIMLTGFLVGIPLFYNAGFVILIPLVFSVSSTLQIPALRVGIPMAASLSVTHGFLPPHPAPTSIASIFQADLVTTLLFGLVIALPAAIVAGPLLAKRLSGMAGTAPSIYPANMDMAKGSPAVSFLISLLPVVIMTIGALSDVINIFQPMSSVLRWIGKPEVALFISCLVAWLYALRMGRHASDLRVELKSATISILTILAVILAGGVFKQVLIQSGVADSVAARVSGLSLSPLVLAWLLAGLIRVAVGSATVAALTAAGLVQSVVATAGVRPELMVLAIGAGSLMFSHVNDTGFWMFKEYFNLTLRQTFLSWTLMETVVSLLGLLGVLALNKIL